MPHSHLKKGIQLFNQEKFFECHEVIEKLWLETKGPDKDFYKGIIQAAVALHHLKKGNISGALGLFKSSIQHLEAYQPKTLGLDVHKLIRDMKDCFRPFEGTAVNTANVKVDVRNLKIPVLTSYFGEDVRRNSR